MKTTPLPPIRGRPSGLPSDCKQDVSPLNKYIRMDVLIIILMMALAFELYFVHTDAKRQDNENDNENDHLTPTAV